jgi:rRNA maturation endonuclease Nob1
MLTPSETTSYERNSNTAAGLCAGCAKVLDDDEVHCCNECASDAYIEAGKNGVKSDG